MSQDIEPLNEREKVIASGGDPDTEMPDVATAGEGEVTEDAEGMEAPPSPEEQPEEEAVPEETAEEVSPPAEEEPWYKAHLHEAGDYGLAEGDLKEISSEAEYRRLTMLMDRHLLKQPAAREEPAREPAAPPPEKRAEKTEEPLDPQKYIDAGYDEEVVSLVKRIADQSSRLESQAKQLDELAEFNRQAVAQQAQESRQYFVDAFHDVLDNMDADRYGRSVVDDGVVALEERFDGNRRKVYEAVGKIIDSYVAKAPEGAPPKIPPLQSLVRRAEVAVFGGSQSRDTRVAEQSKRRRQVAGSTRRSAPKPKEGDGDPVMDLVNHPDVVAMWNRFQEENGG